MPINIMNALRARGIGVGSKLEGTAQIGDVRSTKTFMNASGGPLTGILITRDGGGAVSVTPGATAQTLQAGIYDNNISIAGDADLISANIKSGKNIFGVAGKTEVIDTTEASAPAATGEILLNKVAFVNGVKVTGTMPNNGSVGTQSLTAQNQEYTIPAGYHNGLGKVKAAITNLAAAVIKAGVTVGGIAGTFTNDATAGTSHILNGYTAFVNGVKVTGNIPSKAAATYTPGQSAQTIAAGQYLSGAQTISAVSFDATKVLTGTTIAGKAGTMPNNGSQTTTLSITGSGKPTKSISAGYVTASTITAEVSSALASSIKSGVTIGGCLGTLVGLTNERKWTTGTISSPPTGTNETVLTIPHNLGVMPTVILTGLNNTVFTNHSSVYWSGHFNIAFSHVESDGIKDNAYYNITTTSCQVTLARATSGTSTVTWLAIA